MTMTKKRFLSRRLACLFTTALIASPVYLINNKSANAADFTVADGIVIVVTDNNGATAGTTAVETTDGVTNAEIVLALIELLPISIAVLFAGHVSFLAKVKVCVRLSAQTTTLPAVFVVAAVATVPAKSAPTIKAIVTFRGVRVIFMS